MLGNLKATIKLVMLALWIGLCFILLAIAYKLQKLRIRDDIVRISSSGILRIMGIRLTATGLPSDIRPLLLVSNHISYLDVLILNAKAPIHFTPKMEISHWPVIKTISRMGGSVFIDRRPDKIMEGKEKIKSVLAEGRMICIFPEATTGTGLHTVPFKSGFFSLAEDKINGKDLTIQPVAVTYTTIRRLPLDTTQWPAIAWYGDMELASHFWNILKIAPIEAELVFLSPVTYKDYGDRKKLASHCQKVIEETIQTIRGRHQHARVKPKKFHPRFLRLKNNKLHLR